MQFPIKVHYAILAALAMAEVYEGDNLLAARTISTQQGIPAQFLGQILQQLRFSGIIASVRGASGGFRLARRPAETSVADVVGAVCPRSSCATSHTQCSSALATAVDSMWQELDSVQREALQRVSLADLLERAQPRSAEMFYI